MKKIGLLSLALVLALGTLGIGYASWTDTLYIEGEVNTGTVDIDIVALSGTWVWKIVDTHDTVYHHGWGTTLGGPEDFVPPAGALLVASATADLVAYGDDGDMDGAYVTFDNLYPCDYFMVDILVHYVGSIPVRLDVEIDYIDDLLLDLLADGAIGVEAFEYYPQESENPTVGGMANIGPQIINFCGYQLHYCDWILLKVWIHVPQEDDYMDKDGGFAVSIDAIQWNEYEDYIE